VIQSQHQYKEDLIKWHSQNRQHQNQSKAAQQSNQTAAHAGLVAVNADMAASLDIIVALMYLGAVIYTRRLAFAMFLPALFMSDVLAGSIIDYLTKTPSSPEFVYFLAQSMIWLIPPMLLRKSPQLALCSLSMCIYEWLVAVESFTWQYITPVETPLHSEYAFLVVAIHLFNLSCATKWGGEIGHINWGRGTGLRAVADLQVLAIHHQRGEK